MELTPGVAKLFKNWQTDHEALLQQILLNMFHKIYLHYSPETEWANRITNAVTNQNVADIGNTPTARHVTLKRKLHLINSIKQSGNKYLKGKFGAAPFFASTNQTMSAHQYKYSHKLGYNERHVIVIL